MSHTPKNHKRAGSRASLASVGQLPIISEDGNEGALPKMSLRVPTRNPRRSLGPRTATPQDKYLMECRYDQDREKSATGQMKPPLRRHGRQNADRLFPDSRQRRCRFILVISVVLVFAVGLAVGLSLGLLKKHKASSPDDSSPEFMTGSFEFDTTLQKSSTGCTSNPDTWRCFPFEDGSPVKFYWTIESYEPSSRYNVSSSDNPFAPSFSNLTMTLLDGNQASERFVFSFQMNRTVVPSSPLAPSNRAAKCIYHHTTFQATLWTRRVGRSPGLSRRQSGYSSWPGVVEIAEIKKAALGSPACEDDQGHPIADVQAGPGTCECLYATKQQSAT